MILDSAAIEARMMSRWCVWTMRLDVYGNVPPVNEAYQMKDAGKTTAPFNCLPNTDTSKGLCNRIQRHELLPMTVRTQFPLTFVQLPAKEKSTQPSGAPHLHFSTGY